MNKKLRKLLIGDLGLRRFMTSLLLIPLLVYAGLLIYAYFYADRVIFQPQASSYRDGANVIKLGTADGETISARFFPAAFGAHTILFSHGNAEDIGLLDSTAADFKSAGLAFFAYDYRGYGTSGGAPSEEKAYLDIDAAYEYLTVELKIPPEKIIVYGRSLGGAVSIDLAARKKVGALIAESTFVSAFRVLTKIQVTPFDRFQSLRKIKNVRCPVMIVHGRKDRVISFWHGEKLFEAAGEPKFSYWIDEAGHNDLADVGGQTYLKSIRDFVDNLPE